MFRFVIINRTLFSAIRSIAVAHKELHFLEVYRPFSSSSITNASNDYPLVVSYMINSCGLSRERALFASKHVKFETPQKADSVLAFLKNHGLTDTQISSVIGSHPQLLLSSPDVTFLPKIQFLQSIGLSSSEIPGLICKTPSILVSSLAKNLLPGYNLLKDVLRSDEDALKVIKRFPEVLVKNFETRVAPKIEILREAGVEESGILYCLTYKQRALTRISHRFRECVERVKRMGFNPQTLAFVEGVNAMAILSTTTWNRRMEMYKKRGWSDEEFLAAFKRRPQCMLTPESKIIEVFNLLVGKMGYDSSDLARRPKIITLSMAKTISPRCSVFQVLLSKGLVKNKLSPGYWLDRPEKHFLERFVKRYKKEAPELLNLYQEKMQLLK